MDTKKYKILVTGGLGYIGSHVVVELQKSGFEVIIIDDLSNSSEDVLNGIYKISGVKPVFEKLITNEELARKDIIGATEDIEQGLGFNYIHKEEHVINSIVIDSSVSSSSVNIHLCLSTSFM